MAHLVLASTSVYRKQLLSNLGLAFESIAPTCDEESLKRENPHLNPLERVKFLSRAKAQSLLPTYSESVIIGSDQSAVFNENEILGKPHTREKNIESLLKLSGHKHTLLTGLCILYRGHVYEHVDKTHLFMYPLSVEEIQNYVEQEDALKCAGGYKIEGRGLTLFSKIETSDHSAITGLPLLKLVQILRDLDIGFFQ